MLFYFIRLLLFTHSSPRLSGYDDISHKVSKRNQSIATINTQVSWTNFKEVFELLVLFKGLHYPCSYETVLPSWSRRMIFVQSWGYRVGQEKRRQVQQWSQLSKCRTGIKISYRSSRFPLLRSPLPPTTTCNNNFPSYYHRRQSTQTLFPQLQSFDNLIPQLVASCRRTKSHSLSERCSSRKAEDAPLSVDTAISLELPLGFQRFRNRASLIQFHCGLGAAPPVTLLVWCYQS